MKARGLNRILMLGVVCMTAVFLSSCATTQLSGSMKNTVLINAPVEKVYAWVVDPQNIPKRLPDQTLTDFHGSGLGAGYHFVIKNNYGSFEGDQVVTGYIPNQLWVEQDVVGMDGFETWTWIFIPEGKQTRIILTGQATSTVPAAAKALGNEKILSLLKEGQDEQLKRVKAGVEK